MSSEYYFSVENLVRDVYIRKQMDAQGFVHLAILANFNRVRALTTDLEQIKEVSLFFFFLFFSSFLLFVVPT